MFFIGVMGIDNKEKEVKKINNFYCKGCTQSVKGKLIKSFSYFHFFFIPILKWNQHYYLICENCQSVYEIPKDKGEAFERGEISEISYWDLKELNLNSEYMICNNCGRKIDGEYKFCPYCGSKIK